MQQTKTIHVTQDDMDKSRRLRSRREYRASRQCPIALAVAREFGVEKSQWLYTYGSVPDTLLSAVNKKEVSDWVELYDNEPYKLFPKQAEPMEFQVTYEDVRRDENEGVD